MAIVIDQSLVDKATDFIYEHHPHYKDKEELRTRVQGHYNFKTCRIILDSSDMVCAVCLWNIVNNGEAAFITEMVIREDQRKKDIMRKILIDGMKIWPVKFLMFDREKKDGTIREGKIWSIERFLRRKA